MAHGHSRNYTTLTDATLGFFTLSPFHLALPLQYSRLQHAAVVPSKPEFLKRCAIVGLADAKADKIPTLTIIDPQYLGLALRHAG